MNSQEKRIGRALLKIETACASAGMDIANLRKLSEALFGKDSSFKINPEIIIILADRLVREQVFLKNFSANFCAEAQKAYDPKLAFYNVLEQSFGTTYFAERQKKQKPPPTPVRPAPKLSPYQLAAERWGMSVDDVQIIICRNDEADYPRPR